MHFRMYDDTKARAWGNPSHEELRDAVKTLRRANSGTVTALAVLFSLAFLLFAASGTNNRLTRELNDGWLMSLLALTVISGGTLWLLTRGEKKSKAVIKQAQDAGNAIAVDSDGYQLLATALYRAYRLRLPVLLDGSSEYDSAMLDYVNAVQPLETELREIATGRKAKLAIHRQLVVAADAAADTIAQIYQDENAIGA